MGLKFRKFQIEDYARAAMRDGCILGHDTGLGKSIAAFAWPTIKRARRVLIVAPGSLHLQLKETARDFFKFPVLPLEDQNAFYAWNLHQPPKERDKPLFFITTYQALGMNHADEWAPNEEWVQSGEGDVNEGDYEPIVNVALKASRKKRLRAQFGKDESKWPCTYESFIQGIGTTGPKDDLFSVSAVVWSNLNGTTPTPKDSKIKCIWTPCLARLIQTHNSFDCVVVDEGTRLQSNTAKIATGVRMLNPLYRLVLSATPIKNRLESMFWLAWWAAGGTEEGNARWPYGGTSSEKEKFANQHLQHDRFLGREQNAEAMGLPLRKISRRTSRITNLHKLWKIVAPICLRRRKADCGEDIVPKRVATIRVKPGVKQLEVYQHHLHHPPVREGESGYAVAGRQLQMLRMVALCPNANLLKEYGLASPFSMTPKLLAIMTVVEDRLKRGEQLMIGSNFLEWGKTVHDLLVSAGVRSVLLDGRTEPGKRGELARDFKDRGYSVMVGGLQAMGEGHSFDTCANLILPSLDWAYDTNKQFVDRIWRLTTRQPITVYTFLMENSIDEHLHTLFEEKNDSSQLALDGALFSGEENDEESLEKLLQNAITGFRGDAPAIPEQTLVDQWVDLVPRLRAAQGNFFTNNPLAN